MCIQGKKGSYLATNYSYNHSPYQMYRHSYNNVLTEHCMQQLVYVSTCIKSSVSCSQLLKYVSSCNVPSQLASYNIMYAPIVSCYVKVTRCFALDKTKFKAILHVTWSNCVPTKSTRFTNVVNSQLATQLHALIANCHLYKYVTKFENPRLVNIRPCTIRNTITII